MPRLGNHGDSNSEPKRYKSKPRGHATIAVSNASELIFWIDSLADVGGAIRLGKSRDGGVVAVGIYGNGDSPYTIYLHDCGELTEVIRCVVDEITARTVRLGYAKKVLSEAQERA